VTESLEYLIVDALAYAAWAASLAEDSKRSGISLKRLCRLLVQPETGTPGRAEWRSGQPNTNAELQAWPKVSVLSRHHPRDQCPRITEQGVWTMHSNLAGFSQASRRPALAGSIHFVNRNAALANCRGL